jgi:hypothetical protein
MRDAEGKRSAPALRQPQHFVVPDRLPGETEYRVFVNHLTGCANCGYGQIQCEKATELWQAYKTVKKHATKRT